MWGTWEENLNFWGRTKYLKSPESSEPPEYPEYPEYPGIAESNLSTIENFGTEDKDKDKRVENNTETEKNWNQNQNRNQKHFLFHITRTDIVSR